MLYHIHGIYFIITYLALSFEISFTMASYSKYSL